MKKRKKHITNIKTLRKTAHVEFDKLWKHGKYPMYREDAYEWLAEKLDISVKNCHFAVFDENTLLKILDILEIKHDSVV